MIFLLNNTLIEKKKAYIAISKIYGIGLNYSKILCYRLGISTHGKLADFSEDLKKSLTKFINLESSIDRELKGLELNDIKMKINIKSYKGLRHQQGLPVNGQNTKNNSKTAKKLLRKINNDK